MNYEVVGIYEFGMSLGRLLGAAPPRTYRSVALVGVLH